MNYQEERSSDCRISDSWTYKGLKTVILENNLIQVIVLADKGADIYSFIDKETDTDVLWKTPWGVRDPKKTVPPTGDPASVWLDFYEGGWQTVLPNGGYPGNVNGADLGLHSDVNNIPWECSILVDSPERVSVIFSAKSIRYPLNIERKLTLYNHSKILEIEQTIHNDGEENIDVVWLEHIALGEPIISENSTLYLPEKSTILTHPDDVEASSKLNPDFKGPWPYAELKNGNKIDFRKIPPKKDRSLDMAYISEMDKGWYAIRNNKNNLGWVVSYPEEIFKYLWYWRNFGGGYGYPFYGRSYNAGLEPCTSYNNSGLEESIKNGTSLKLEPKETIKAKINAGIFSGSGKIIDVDENCNIIFED